MTFDLDLDLDLGLTIREMDFSFGPTAKSWEKFQKIAEIDICQNIYGKCLNLCPKPDSKSFTFVEGNQQ